MAASKATIFTFILAHLLRFWQYYIIPKRISWQDNFNVKKVPVSIFRQKRHLPGMLLSADWRFPVRRSLRRYTGSQPEEWISSISLSESIRKFHSGFRVQQTGSLHCLWGYFRCWCPHSHLQLCSPESYLRLWSGRQCRGRLPARCGCNPEIQKRNLFWLCFPDHSHAQSTWHSLQTTDWICRHR